MYKDRKNMLALLLQQFNITQLMENAVDLSDFVAVQQLETMDIIRRSESDFLYYDPPLFVNPEYLTDYRSYPASFPSSYFIDEGIRLSFDFQKSMYLQYEEISSRLSDANFQHHFREGQILENLQTTPSAAQLEEISKDIVIIDLGIGMTAQWINGLFANILTPFDRIWIYDSHDDEFVMVSAEDFDNHGFKGDIKPSLRLEELERIYNEIEEQSESQYEYYRNKIFINFFVLFKEYSNRAIYGKMTGNYNVFFWYGVEPDKTTKSHLLTRHSYFCKLRTQGEAVKNRNSCVRQAIEVISEHNYDTSTLLWVNGSQLLVGRADYRKDRYVGFNYSYFGIEEFSTNCMLDYLSYVNIGLSYQGNDFLYVSHFNENKAQYKINDQVVTYKQILPFPIRRMNVQERALTYNRIETSYITDSSRFVGFLEKTAGQFLYQNMTEKYTIQITLGDVSSLYRRRCTPQRVEQDQFDRNIDSYLHTIQKLQSGEVKDELTILDELKMNSSRGNPPLEPDEHFSVTDFSEMLSSVAEDGTLKIGYYIPFLNDSLDILKNYGNTDLFEAEIQASMQKLFSGDFEGAQEILNPFVRFKYLDIDKTSYFSGRTVCEQLDNMDYFIRKYDKSSDYADKLLVDDSLRIDYHKSKYEGKTDQEISNMPIFSPVLADILFQSQAELMFTIREYIMLNRANLSGDTKEILINRNVFVTGDYYRDIMVNGDLNDPFYREDLLQAFYMAINLNVIAVFDRGYFTEEHVRLAVNEAYTLQDNSEYRIVHLSNGKQHHAVIESISSFNRVITNREVPEVFLYNEIPEITMEELKINESYMIFDSHGQIVRRPRFSQEEGDDLQNIFDNLHMEAMIVDDLVSIGFLEIQRANFSATIQKGLTSVNQSFDYRKENAYLSHIVQNMSDPSLKCFGRRIQNPFVVTAEYFVCKFTNSQQFIVGVNHFVPNMQLANNYTHNDFANINYGYYHDIYYLFQREDSAIVHFYNFTQRSANSRNIINSKYNPERRTRIDYFEAEEALFACFIALTTIAFLMIFSPKNERPGFLAMKKLVVNLNEMSENRFEDEPIIEIEQQDVAPIEIPAVRVAVGEDRYSHRIVFAQDYETVAKYEFLRERIPSGSETHFSLLSAHEEDRPNGVVYQTNFVIQRNIFANANYCEYYDQEIRINNEIFVVHYDFGSGVEVPMAAHGFIEGYEDFYDRQLRAPCPNPQTAQFGGYLEFTDLILMVTR